MFRVIKKSDSDSEQLLLTGVIASDEIAAVLLPRITVTLLETHAARTIISWVKAYHEQYGDAPKAHIQDIYNEYKDTLQEKLHTEVLELLSKVTDTAASDINARYVIAESTRFLRKQQITLRADTARALLLRGKLSEAELALSDSLPVDGGLESWVNPIRDRDFIIRALDNRLDASNALFKLSGALGEYIGPLHRGWLVSVVGPMKRGKSWLLQNIALNCAMAGKRTIFVSLEMSAEDITIRQMQILSMRDLVSGDYPIPEFDCVYNQTNSCSKTQRVNRVPFPQLLHPGQQSTYGTCCVCRGTKAFKPSIWNTFRHIDELDTRNCMEILRLFDRQFGGDRLRVKAYPLESVSIPDISNDIKTLELQSKWVPDVIVIDYADILATVPATLQGRERENSIWRALKQMAGARQCLIVTGTQGNRDSFTADSLSESNVSEDIRKLAHPDIILSLNSTDVEKGLGVMRIGILAHRWKRFLKSRQVMVLQNLSLGQFHLDSEEISIEPKHKK